ncbi:hypothetical protein ACFL59_06735 [Planctomycetota bacterium]
MQRAYLEVTYRHGRPLAAYYYLSRPDKAHCHRTRKAADGILVDFDEASSAIGLEIAAAEHVSAEALNRVLSELGQAPLSERELSPLCAAQYCLWPASATVLRCRPLSRRDLLGSLRQASCELSEQEEASCMVFTVPIHPKVAMGMGCLSELLFCTGWSCPD